MDTFKNKSITHKKLKSIKKLTEELKKDRLKFKAGKGKVLKSLKDLLKTE